MALRPEYLTFISLIDKKLFSIPNYQRAYSWNGKQRQDLFSDIRKLNSNNCDRHHFMATIVCLRKNQTEEIGTDILHRLDVVDGQQRLTTLIILLKAVSKKLSWGSTEEKEEAQKINDLLVKDNERLILLQTNHDSSMLFSEYLKRGTKPDENIIKTLAEHNLFNAFNESEEFVNEWCESYEPIDLLKIIKNRLDFIFYALEDEGAVYTVFEVLNSRGLEVDWLDKCKSMLMGIAFESFPPDVAKEKIEELHTYWSAIYRIIGKKLLSGREILSFTATLYNKVQISKPLSADKAIDLFRELALEDNSNILEITIWIRDICEKLVELYKNKRLNAVTGISHARLLAIAIQLSNLKSFEQRELLVFWERITFRIFGICRKDSRTKVGDYTRLSFDIINQQMKKQKIIEVMRSIGSDYPIEDCVKELKETDCYNNWEGDLKYFLYKYEEYLSNEQGENISDEVWEKIWSASPSTTIEHIHPKGVLTANWKGKISNRQDHVEKHVHRLGNLILLPPNINSKAGQRSFEEKKEIYKQNILRMMNDILGKDDWGRQEIEQREKILISFAKEMWCDPR